MARTGPDLLKIASPIPGALGTKAERRNRGENSPAGAFDRMCRKRLRGRTRLATDSIEAIDLSKMTDERMRLKIERCRPRLQRDLEELLAPSERTVETRGPVQLDQQSVGRLSRMDAIQAQQMALAAERQRKTQINRIRRALNDIELGEFGWCAICGDEIPDGRLDPDPAVHLCINCAAARSA